eukprot:766337-Hanusia_phi.AAC.6
MLPLDPDRRDFTIEPEVGGGPVLKLSRKRTVFFSSGTVVPPLVISTNFFCWCLNGGRGWQPGLTRSDLECLATKALVASHAVRQEVGTYAQERVNPYACIVRYKSPDERRSLTPTPAQTCSREGSKASSTFALVHSMLALMASHSTHKVILRPVQAMRA